MVLSANDPKRTSKRCGHRCYRSGPSKSWLELLAVHAERAHIYAMAGAKVTRVFGAIYEVIKTEGPSEETRPYKCVLCDRELFVGDEDIVATGDAPGDLPLFFEH